jgi:hypothetical protein
VGAEFAAAAARLLFRLLAQRVGEILELVQHGAGAMRGSVTTMSAHVLKCCDTGQRERKTSHCRDRCGE